MRVLVIGGGGYVGIPLTRRLRDRGHAVTSLAIARPPVRVRSVQQRIGDRNDRALLQRLSAEGYEAVVDLVAYHPEQTELVVDCWKTTGARLVHLSTIAVYEQPGIPVATESDCAVSTEAGWSYRARKAGCERALEQAAARSEVEYVILRPPPIIGAGDAASRENYILARLIDEGLVRLPSSPQGVAHMLDLRDLVDAICSAVEVRGAANQAYHLAMDPSPTLGEHVEAIRDAARLSLARIEEMAVAPLVHSGFTIAAFPYPLCGTERFDIAKARQDLGFDPRPHRMAVRHVVGALLREPAASRGMWPGRQTAQARLSGAHPWLHADLERQVFRREEAPAFVSNEEVLAALASNALAAAGKYSPCRIEDMPPVSSLGGGDKLLVAAPAALLERLGLRADSPTTGAIAAVVEPLAGTTDMFELFVQSGPRLHQEYGHERSPANPVRLIIGGFIAPSKFEPEAGALHLLESESAEDRAALLGWAHDQERAARAPAMALSTLARIFLVNEGRCAGASQWAYIFSIARILLSAGMSGSVRLQMASRHAAALVRRGVERLGDAELDEDDLVFQADGQWYYASLQTRRLFALQGVVGGARGEP